MSAYTAYACCPTCKGVVGLMSSGSELDSRRDEAVIQEAGYRAYVTGPAAKTAYPVGYKLKDGCSHSHVFEVPA